MLPCVVPPPSCLRPLLACGLLLLSLAVAAQTESPVESAPATDDTADQIDALRSRLSEMEALNTELGERLDAARAAGDESAAELQVLRDEIAAQRNQIARQLGELEKQQERLAFQEERLARLEQEAVSLNARLLELQDQLPDSTLAASMAERLERVESSVEELPELPAEVVSAGEFPGSFRIPGTDAMLKIGGLVKASLVLNLDALATDDRFFTAGIPISGTQEAGKGPRLTMSARHSRFNFDLRTPTGVGHVRAFIEGDFVGEGNTFRLRHAYGQFNKYVFGQTWSTLVDLLAVPEQVDFEGLNAQILLRKAQLRGIYPLGGHDVSVGIEDPAPDLTGANGVSLVPDIVAGTTWAVPWSHFRTAVILRQLKGEVEANPGRTYSRFAWGVSLSGRVDLPSISEDDNVRFAAHFGEGYGRYVNDLGAVGGQDAVFDAAQDRLRTLPVYAGHISYSHWWKTESWRSSLCFGLVHVDNLDIQADDAYRQTYRISLNLIYSPAPRMDAGIEVLHGRRVNKDRQDGRATQIQLAWYFRF